MPVTKEKRAVLFVRKEHSVSTVPRSAIAIQTTLDFVIMSLAIACVYPTSVASNVNHTALKNLSTLHHATDFAIARTTDRVAVITSVAYVNEDGWAIIVKNPVHQVFTEKTALRPVLIALAAVGFWF
jgi:hypothetical protein